MTDTQNAKQILCPRQKRENPSISRLFRARGVLGHRLGTLRHGVLGQLAGENEADGGLDFPGGDGGLLVVGRELRSLGSDALKDV